MSVPGRATVGGRMMAPPRSICAMRRVVVASRCNLHDQALGIDTP